MKQIIKITSSKSTEEKAVPTFVHWLYATVAIFQRLSGIQKANVGVFLGLTLMCAMTIGAWVSINTNPPKTIIVPVVQASSEKADAEEEIVPEIPQTSVFVGEKETLDENPPEPAPAKNLTAYKTQAQAYIQKYKAAAQAGWRKHGVPASISLAQGLIESRAGTSKLAVQNNNHFGMKCFSKKCGKGHCTNHKDDTHKDFFLKFKSPAQSWEAHSKLLSSGRYAKLKKYGRDYVRWAQGLKQVGYATDKSYANTLISVIKRYNLTKYD